MITNVFVEAVMIYAILLCCINIGIKAVYTVIVYE